MASTIAAGLRPADVDELREHVARLFERFESIADKAEEEEEDVNLDPACGEYVAFDVLFLAADAALDASRALDELAERIREAACRLAGRDERGGYAARLGGGS